jgi:hypothetical protein
MKRAALLLLCAALMPAAVFAADSGDAGGKGGDNPCRADMKKFCQDVKPGEGRLVKCLKEHREELSAECKEHQKEKFAEKHPKAAQAMDACKADADKLCSGVEAGGGKIMKCLREHKKDVSEGCKSAMKDARAERRERRAAKSAQTGAGAAPGSEDKPGSNQ